MFEGSRGSWYHEPLVGFYVGRPAVGTSKAAPADGIPSVGPRDTRTVAVVD